MSLARRSATLLTGETAARAAGVVLYAVLARVLGVEAFGIVSLGMTVALIAGTMVDLGQTAHVGRVAAEEPGSMTGLVRVIFTTKPLLGMMVCVIVGAGLWASGFPKDAVAVAVGMTAWAAVLSVFESERALLRAVGLTRQDALANGLESILRLCVVAAACVVSVSVLGAVAGFVAEALIALVVLTLVLRRRRPTTPEAAEVQSVWTVLRESAPIGAAAIALAVFYRIDQAFVAGIAGAAANGLYGAAARIAFTANVVAQIVVSAAYPQLAAVRGDGAAYAGALQHALRMVIGASGLVAAGVALLAWPAVWLLYGTAYSAAVPLLQVLSLTVLLNGASALGLYSAVALRRERRSLAVVVGLTPLVVIAYALGVREHGAMGAAWVSVGGEAALAACLLALSGDLLFRRSRVAA